MGNISLSVGRLETSHLFWFNMLPHGGDMLLPTPTPFSFFFFFKLGRREKNAAIHKYFLFVEVL